MNEEYFQYALQLLDELTNDELEAKLLEYGFNPRRKVAMFAADELYAPAEHALQEAIRNYALPELLPLESWAANDNSYALAA